ncbi:hypothetical protein V5030_13920 [Moellerella wisconsensis]|uniref:hypothetical protein n=1 Tax=Moellerella wisconsensis TaxID=158849 RepID=UPI003075F1FE
MKRNIDDFDGMNDFIISIIGAIAWFLIGIIVVIGYFTVETKGESIILSYISTIFTVISSLGITATIGVYIWQKNDSQRKQHEYEKNFFSDIKRTAKEFILTSNKYKKSFEETLKNFDKAHDEIVINKVDSSILIIKVERYGVLKNLEHISNYQPVLNLEKTRMDPALLSNDRYVFYIESKSILEEINLFIKGFILNDTSELSISIDEKMNFYLKNIYHIHITNLIKIVNIN